MSFRIYAYQNFPPPPVKVIRYSFLNGISEAVLDSSFPMKRFGVDFHFHLTGFVTMSDDLYNDRCNGRWSSSLFTGIDNGL
jgi:hypothetical protein